MEKQNEQEQQEPTQLQPQDINNRVRVGDIELISPFESIDNLLEKIKSLLKDKDVGNYLTQRFIQIKKQMSYTE